MAHDKRFKAWKKQHRRRKKAKARVKEYAAGKVGYDKLPALARKMLKRRRPAAAPAA